MTPEKLGDLSTISSGYLLVAGDLFSVDIVLDVPELGIYPAQTVCQFHQLVTVEHPATDK